MPTDDLIENHEQTCRRSAALRTAPTIEHPPVVRSTPDAEIAALLSSLSRTRYSRFLSAITTPRTRHSLSPEFRSIMDFATTELEDAGYTVTRTPVSVGAGTSANLIAHLPGRGTDTRNLVLATAHLDSVNETGRSLPAPGADDNASGSAGVLELGAVLAGRKWENDVVLILFGGEEQGLLGSIEYVEALTPEQRTQISAVINMDMIGRRNTAISGVMIEGGQNSQPLMNELVAAAGTYTQLSVTTSLNPFASDHVPFIDAGLPAVLTIEADDRANTDVHTDRDTLATVDPSLAMEILRMNLAVLATHLGVVRDGPLVNTEVVGAADWSA
ncbi:M28 family metallopeptidase [Nocardia sp. 348MFTsu5.1]|uniref:M28 family metallopeptidase n=1 Tax=Nocardia sp. 348MFTsu5.1 TaxID=1172185 RepID=UPI0018C93F7E|nr:M28 family metallopeptidase [Nocardia sp. 348MFTsu5.1]